MSSTSKYEGTPPVYNRFDLVLLAAQRGREIAGGATPTLERNGDKNPVLALREINERTVSLEDLQEALIKNLQKNIMGDDVGDEEEGDQFVELMVEEQLYLRENADPLAMPGFSIEEDPLEDFADGDSACALNDEENSPQDFTDSEINEK